VWARLLRNGGALGIAWNTLVAPRDQAAQILASAGLETMDTGPYLAFRHRVDQAIMRDILVARSPSGLVPLPRSFRYRAAFRRRSPPDHP
jgi:hypothetical protein